MEIRPNLREYRQPMPAADAQPHRMHAPRLRHQSPGAGLSLAKWARSVDETTKQTNQRLAALREPLQNSLSRLKKTRLLDEKVKEEKQNWVDKKPVDGTALLKQIKDTMLLFNPRDAASDTIDPRNPFASRLPAEAPTDAAGWKRLEDLIQDMWLDAKETSEVQKQNYEDFSQKSTQVLEILFFALNAVLRLFQALSRR